MNFLLDTCILSELRKRKPEKRVVTWVGLLEESRLYISVVTLGEIQKGISKLADSKHKESLRIWLEQDLRNRFGRRILAIDIEVSLVWGHLHGERERNGEPVPVVDCLIAATAIQHNLIVVTRNTVDFQRFSAQVFNPWLIS